MTIGSLYQFFDWYLQNAFITSSSCAATFKVPTSLQIVLWLIHNDCLIISNKWINTYKIKLLLPKLVQYIQHPFNTSNSEFFRILSSGHTDDQISSGPLCHFKRLLQKSSQTCLSLSRSHFTPRIFYSNQSKPGNKDKCKH